jgi:lipopolysaccharide export LptBFGC system permease protein LptF
LVLVSVLFIGAQAVTQEVLVPAVAPLLTRDAGDSGKRDVRSFVVRLAPDDRGRLYFAKRYMDDRVTMVDVTIWERVEARITRVITAEEARYDGSGWTFLNGFASVPTERGAPVRTPIDRIDSSLDPAALKVRALQGFGQSLSWMQISQLVEEGALDDGRRTELDRLRWGRVAGLASTMVTVLAAMPFFLRRAPGPMLGACLRAAPIAGAGLIAAAAAPVLELPGLPVPLAAFVPTMVLVPIAIALMSGIKT